MDNLDRTSSTSGFEFNHPTIISLLYLASAVTGVTAIIGVVLAYVWRDEASEPWETSHYKYLINTFWLGLVGSIVGAILVFAVVGLIILPVVVVIVIIRCVMSLLAAQKHQSMPNPGTWLV